MSTLRLADIASDPDFFASVAAVSVRVPDCADGGEVSAALEEACSLFGADAVAFGSFIREDESFESYRFILACDPVWCQEYENNACYMHDPWLEHARHYAEPVLAEDIPARSGPEADVVALAERYGFASAVIVPTQPPRSLTRLGVLILGSATQDYFDASTLPSVAFAATGLTSQLNGWQITRLRAELLSRTRLSEADIALLVKEREGMTSKEVARLMQSTAQSIDSRWQRLNARLGVGSRAAATRLAAEYGVI